jgi:hypothetical protein
LGGGQGKTAGRFGAREETLVAITTRLPPLRVLRLSGLLITVVVTGLRSLNRQGWGMQRGGMATMGVVPTTPHHQVQLDGPQDKSSCDPIHGDPGRRL